MKLKKIDLFGPLTNQYGVIEHFTQEITKALNRHNIDANIIKVDRNDPKGFLDQILNNPPDCTLSFNGLLPDPEGRFLCDLINIPHVAYLTDAPKHYFPLVGSKKNIIACIDQDFSQTFTTVQFPNVLFLPHAVSRDLSPLETPEFLYDVAMFNSYIDYESIREEWQKKHGTALGAVLDEAAEWVLTDRDVPYMHAFFQVLDRHIKAGKPIDPSKLDHIDLLDKLEGYIGGRSRIELLKSVEDVKVDVFGTQKGKKDWKKYLGPKHKNIKIHESVPFLEVFEHMKRTKIILNSTPEIKRGLHERILAGIACGAAVLSLDTPFLSEIFHDEESLLLFSPQNWQEVNRKIQFYLHDEERRQQLVKTGREIVMRNHTWDQRAQTLILELPEILKRIKAQLF